MRFGLIGKTLGHSHSRLLHALLGNPDYRLLELNEAEFDAFMRAGRFRGVNITIPYKERAMAYCHADETARAIGSVNTVVNRGGRLYGYNTDCAGFEYLAERAGISFGGKKVLVLGSGGTAKTVLYAARRAGARETVIISRGGENHYGNLSRHFDSDILVNATPVGMAPEDAKTPVSLDGFAGLTGVLDVIYNPTKTRLVKAVERRGIPAAGGLAMLVKQAYDADKLFFGKPKSARDREAIGLLYERFLQSVEGLP